jgi:hypothetical protein
MMVKWSAFVNAMVVSDVFEKYLLPRTSTREHSAFLRPSIFSLLSARFGAQMK